MMPLIYKSKRTSWVHIAGQNRITIGRHPAIPSFGCQATRIKFGPMRRSLLVTEAEPERRSGLRFHEVLLTAELEKRGYLDRSMMDAARLWIAVRNAKPRAAAPRESGVPFVPSAGEGDHPFGHAVCGRMAGRKPVCMETGERWCGAGIGSPRPRATSPSLPTRQTIRHLERLSEAVARLRI
jgi:hypothetical protein